MLQYPSISKNVNSSFPVFAFDKIDGSNIRVEWSRKTGFSKFGSRTRLLDPQEKPLGEAISIFMNNYAETLDPVLRKTLKVERATLFLEFHGVNSFAGFHEDEAHELTLFDVSLHKKGFMLPNDFLKVFGNIVETPGLLYYGKANSDFIASVRESTLEGMTFEGVVCKSQEVFRGRNVVYKLKSQAWLDKLKTKCNGDDRMFHTLS